MKIYYIGDYHRFVYIRNYLIDGGFDMSNQIIGIPNDIEILKHITIKKDDIVILDELKNGKLLDYPHFTTDKVYGYTEEYFIDHKNDLIKKWNGVKKKIKKKTHLNIVSRFELLDI